MTISDYESLVKDSIYFILFFHFISIICYIINHDLLYNNPISKIGVGLIWLFCLSLIELILMKVILVLDFKYFNQVYAVFVKFGIHDFNFISPFSYFIKFNFFGFFFVFVFENKSIKMLFKFITLALLLFVIFKVVYLKSYLYYDSVTSTIKNIFIVLSSGFFLFKFNKLGSSILSIFKNPYFWIGFGLFITALSEFFLELIFTKLHDSNQIIFHKLYLVRNTFQCLFFIFMTFAILNSKYLRFLQKEY